MKQRYTFTKIFIIAIVIATILNGSSFWLKMVGWLEPHLYQTYWNEIYKERGIPRTDAEFEHLKVFTRDVYRTNGAWTVFKVLKDVVFVLFVAFSFFFMWRYKIRWKMRYGWLFVSITFLLLYAFVRSYFQYSIILSLAGLRSFMFVGVAMIGAWAVRRESLNFLAKSLMVLVLFQLLLVPIEFMYGMHLFTSERIGNRIVGTMLQPSSFGIISGLVLIWYFAFSGIRKWLWCFTVIVFFLVIISGSGTAILLLLFASIVALWTKMVKRLCVWLKCIIIALGGIVVFLLLPFLTGRVNVFESLWGRLLVYKIHLLTGTGWFELLFGRGLGAGTNTAVNLLMDWSANSMHGGGSHFVFVADSTPLMLITQIGVVGLFLVYGVLLFAARIDPQSRIFYLSLILVSLAINITELFPVNFILGLLLARSFSIVQNNDYVDWPIAKITKPVL